VGVADATRQLATFQSGLKQLGANLGQIGQQMAQVGSRMSMGLTAPLLGIGVAAGKMSMDFRQSMQTIVGLVGKSQEQVDVWAKQLMDIGPQISRGPKELAEALYFVTSAGVATKDALDVVVQSGKAAAAGLGETKVIADLVTSALNAYGAENITAGRATDILVAAVREGKAEAPALAGSIGRVIPIAAQLGIGFDEVAGAMAAMTLVGFDAAESATNLSGIMSALLKPSKQAKDELAALGLDMEHLREVAGEQGLLPVLMLLKDSLGDNEEAIAKIFPNVRGLRGMLALVGENADKVATILDKTKNSVGDADKAFQAMAVDTKFQFNQAMAQAQAALITLGDAIMPVLIPILQGLANALRSVAEWFRGLPGPIQQVIVVALALLAALGPILIILGSLASAVGTLIPVVVGFAGAMGSMFAGMRSASLIGQVAEYLGGMKAATLATAGAIGLLVAGLVVIVAWLGKVGEMAGKTNEEVIKLAQSGDLLERSAAAFEILANGSKRLHDVFVEHQTDMKEKLFATVEALEGAQDAQGRYNEAGETAQGVLDRYNEEILRSAKLTGDIVQVSGMYNRARYEEMSATELARQGIVKYENEFYKLGDGVQLITMDLIKARQASREYAHGLTEADLAQRLMARSGGEVQDSIEALIEEQQRLAAEQRAQAEAAAAVQGQFDQLRMFIEGPVGEAWDEYNGQQEEVKEKQAELIEELAKLEAAQGKVATTTSKSALTTEQLAYKQGLLADKTAKLAGVQDQSSLEALKLASEISTLQKQIGGATEATTTFVDNSKRIGEISTELGGLNQAYLDNAAAHGERLKRILFDIAAEQLAVGGLTQVEYEALAGLAEQYGLVDQQTAEMVRNVLGATQQLAEDGSLPAFQGNMTAAFREASGEAKTHADTLEEQRTRARTALADQGAAVGEYAATVAEKAREFKETHIPELAEAAKAVGTETAKAGTALKTELTTTTGAVKTIIGTFLTDVQNTMRTQSPKIKTPLETAFNGMKNAIELTLGDLWGSITGFFSDLAGIQAPSIPAPSVPSVPSVPGAGGGVGGGTPGAGGGGGGGSTRRQFGGPFPAGMRMSINESAFTRPEVVVPDFGGYVLTRQDAMAALARAVMPARAGLAAAGAAGPGVVYTDNSVTNISDRLTAKMYLEERRRRLVEAIEQRM